MSRAKLASSNMTTMICLYVAVELLGHLGKKLFGGSFHVLEYT